MGLDIHIGANNYKELRDEDYLKNWKENFKKYSLSREFCNFMCRKDVVEHEPELDQIRKITNIDISSLYEMQSYSEDSNILKGNIDKVLTTINLLIEKLSLIDNLNEKLIKTDFDTIDSEYYFSDFNLDKGEGYIRNNFGQDLRNFKRFLEFALKRGTTTVWFHFE